MFESLSNRISDAIRTLSGKGVITDENIETVVKAVRSALLEADVALPVVNDFIEKVKEQALGQKLTKSLSPDKAFISIVAKTLTDIMGGAGEEIGLNTQPPAVILMAGLQGAGKTTSAAKLALWLKLRKKKKKVLMVSVDVYRPAALKQLETLAKQVDVDIFLHDGKETPSVIAKKALAEANRRYYDILIVDTAGRLHVDEEMMQEIKTLHAELKPVETLFVVDAMTGQDAVNTAHAFHQALPLTGVILTKADGDARGGAALSVKAITGAPIKFLGVGEKADALEPFHPDRMASRILGMGDIQTLMEDIQHGVDINKAKKIEKKVAAGQLFNFEDMLEQFSQVKKMGGLTKLIDKLPGMSGVSQALQAAEGSKTMSRTEAVILSMTPQERRDPDVINTSRKQRIAKGSGVDMNEINRLMKQLRHTQKLLRKMSNKKGGAAGMMKQMQGMMQGGGGMPKF
ncbi:MAG: signal recognition particle protein [Pseudomonadota bacterium]